MQIATKTMVEYGNMDQETRQWMGELNGCEKRMKASFPYFIEGIPKRDG
jgi:hypothetical protein